MAHEMYKQLPVPEAHIECCPVCGGAPSLWQFSQAPDDPVQRLVACEHSDSIGPQDGMVMDGCLLYMPPNDFYRPTEREAIRYWNEFAKALTALQRKNRWARAQVLRSEKKEAA